MHTDSWQAETEIKDCLAILCCVFSWFGLVSLPSECKDGAVKHLHASWETGAIMCNKYSVWYKNRRLSVHIITNREWKSLAGGKWQSLWDSGDLEAMHVNYHLFSWPQTICAHVNNSRDEDTQGDTNDLDSLFVNLGGRLRKRGKKCRKRTWKKRWETSTMLFLFSSHQHKQIHFADTKCLDYICMIRTIICSHSTHPKYNRLYSHLIMEAESDCISV